MRITLFSSNQPRHINLARLLSEVAEEIYYISEVNTVFPGKVKDFFDNSDVMNIYFNNVIQSELNIFGQLDFLPGNVNTLSIKSGDLNLLSRDQIGTALNSDIYIIFGASYIKGWLVDFLTEKKALNIHMGISPYYRGSSCNFWALYDNKPSYVGATIHFLSKGLDSGDILFHCIPLIKKFDNTFDFTMRSVFAAQKGLVSCIKDRSLFSLNPIKQRKDQEIRYTKNKDFTNETASEFLNRKINASEFEFNYPNLINPIFI